MSLYDFYKVNLDNVSQTIKNIIKMLFLKYVIDKCEVYNLNGKEKNH